MTAKPFLKWAGGKRWLLDHDSFTIPRYSGKYIEPFLGGGAVFFGLRPKEALISDINPLLIEAYAEIKRNWRAISRLLGKYHKNHSPEFYYQQRQRRRGTPPGRAAHFIYLNRACWNGLYRVNRDGQFNVPIGTKDWIVSDSDDFEEVAACLASAELRCCDFEESLSTASAGDFVFLDPPYTTAHNVNGFVKYNERMFSWSDQVRLAHHAMAAVSRGAIVLITNADHHSVRTLYGEADMTALTRASVISGQTKGRRSTTELLIKLGSPEC